MVDTHLPSALCKMYKHGIEVGTFPPIALCNQTNRCSKPKYRCSPRSSRTVQRTFAGTCGDESSPDNKKSCHPTPRSLHCRDTYNS